MSTALTDNMQVRDLIKKFDLEIPEQYRMVAMEWEVVNGVVSITKVHVYNQDGEFVKEADINLLQKNMNKYTFVFHGTK